MSTNKATKAYMGKAIRQARKDLRLSQKDFAKVLRVSDKAVSSYEVGRATPKFETLQKISNILNKPISYFSSKSTTEDIDLQIKIKTIERELLEIKKILLSKKRS